MYMSFNGINFAVRSQQLITSSIEREISVDCEVVFNRMNEEMIKFHDAIFKNRYKSSYNLEDIAILDEYRTVVNIGMIQDLPKKARSSRPRERFHGGFHGDHKSSSFQ